MSAEPIKQEIQLNLDASGIPKNSLAGLIAQLEQVEAKWKSLEATINAQNATLARTPRSVADITAQLKKAQGTLVTQSAGGPGFKASAIAQLLGHDVEAVEKALPRLTKGMEGYRSTMQRFTSLTKAAQVFHEFESKQFAANQRKTLSMRELLKPTVGSVHGVGTGSIKIDGVIPLEIKASQLKPEVIGDILLSIPGGQIKVEGGAAVVRDAAGKVQPGSGAALAGAGVGGGGGKKAGKKQAGLPAAERDKLMNAGNAFVLRQDLVSGAESITISELQKAGETLATTFENVEGRLTESRRVTRGPGGLTPLEQFRQGRRLLTTGFQSDVAKLHPSDIGYGLAALYEKQASQLSGMLPPGLADQLSPAKAKAIQAQLNAGAEKLKAQAASARGEANQVINTGRIRQAVMDINRENPGEAGYLSRDERANLLRSAKAAFTPPKPPKPARAIPRSQQYQGYGMAQMLSMNRPQLPSEPFPELPPGPPPPKPTKLQQAFQQGFTPAGFATHIVKVAGWAAAVTTLYKSFELLDYSMRRVLDVGTQMSHLQVIYTGIGGSVRELTDDLMKQAAVQGRATDDAMESGQEWARILKSRSEINTAVGVSMMAANISGLPDAETTKQLSALMHVYHIEASGLGAELSKLVYISQHWNSSLEDTFEGLDRAGPQARAMGMSLGELSGIIAGTVGKTGQSGSVVGNTIKYLLQQFQRPEMQRMLRGFGIESTGAGGSLKPAPQLLRELFVKYQGMSNTERGSLVTQMAGRFHGSRMVGMLESYVESQKLAIDSQLNLNAAQTANAAILDTLQNKLTGLKSTWDLFVNSQANLPSAALGGFTPMDLMKGTVSGFSRGLQSFNDTGTSAITGLGAPALIGGAVVSRKIMESVIQKGLAHEAESGAGSSLIMNLGRRFGGRALAGMLGGRLATLATGPIGWAASLIPLAAPAGNWLGKTMTPGGDLDPSQWFRGDQWKKISSIMGGRASAAALRGNLFQTTADLLTIKHPDATARGNINAAIGASASEMSPDNAASFNKMIGVGNLTGAMDFLNQQVKAQGVASVNALQMKATSDKNALRDMNAEVARDQSRLDAKPTQTFGPGITTPNRNYISDPVQRQKISDHIADEKKQIEALSQAASESQGVLDEVEGMPQDALDRRQQYISLLQQEKDLLSAIGTLANQGGTGTPVDQLAAQSAGAQMQVDAAQSTLDQIEAFRRQNPDKAVETTPIYEEALQTLQQAQAQRDAFESPQMRRIAELQQNRDIQNRRTDLETAGVGYTETEKLLNQRSNLLADRTPLETKRDLTPEDSNRALRDSVDLYKTNVSLAERMVALKKEERQIMIDSNREFQKSLLMAGPGEMLKRLYLAQVSNRRDPMSTGEFMSWSPDMRKMYYDMRGGDAGAKNREEQGLLAGAGVNGSYAGEISQGKKDQESINFWRSMTGQNTSGALAGMPGPSLSAEGKLATQQVQALGSAAGITATVLRTLNGAIGGLLKTLNQHPASKPDAGKSPSVGISTGYSLGAKIGLAMMGF